MRRLASTFHPKSCESGSSGLHRTVNTHLFGCSQLSKSGSFHDLPFNHWLLKFNPE